MKHEIIGIDKLTSNKYVNLYCVKYKCDNVKRVSYMSSRKRNVDELPVYKKTCNEVKVVPYLIKNGFSFIFFIKRYRPMLNDYVYSLPSNFVGKTEKPEQTVINLLASLKAKVISIRKSDDNSFINEGLTDELIECYQAQIETDTQNEEEINDSEIYTVQIENLENFLMENEVDLTSRLLCKVFYYEQLIKESE